MNEIWKEVLGYEGLYEVSNFGEVRSLDRSISTVQGIKFFKGTVLNKAISNWGYERVVLCNNSKRKHVRVHRLVASAFIQNLHNKSQVNHIDGNKLNNHVSNLEWSTRIENMNHARITGLVPNSNKSSYFSLLDKDLNIVSQYDSFSSFSKSTGIATSKLLQTLSNNNVDYEFIDTIDNNLPLNVPLNMFSKSARYFPLEICDENMKTLAIFTNIANMVIYTGIPENRGTQASKKGIEKYKRRGKKYKKTYYIKKISFVDFFTSTSPIIDNHLTIDN